MGTAKDEIQSGFLKNMGGAAWAVVAFFLLIAGGVGTYYFAGDEVAAGFNFTRTVEDNTKAIAELTAWKKQLTDQRLIEQRADIEKDGVFNRLTEDVSKINELNVLVNNLRTSVDDLEDGLQDAREDANRRDEAIAKNTSSRNSQVLRATRRSKDHTVRDAKQTYLLNTDAQIKETLFKIRDVLIKQGFDIPWKEPEPIRVDKETGEQIKNE